jgi:arginyl-tRNA synthetase
MNGKIEFANFIKESINNDLTLQQIETLLEKPKQIQQGDIAFPCFHLAKIQKKSPNVIANKISLNQHPEIFEKVEAIGGYVNAFLNKNQVATHVLTQILKEKEEYGSHSFGENKTIVLDFSSPNIARTFSMGHLRSTVIGSSLAAISTKCGYKTVKVNHLGDWGTQFGKLISAYVRWGTEEAVRNNPIPELLSLYVRFHEEAENNPQLIDEGRLWFKKLEDGDEEAAKLWKWFREVSLDAFHNIYELLGVSFDSYNGEAFYNDKMESTVEKLNEAKLLEKSEGAIIVRVGEDLPPCLIKKSDGATLYATRDLTAAIYRKEMYDFDHAFYVVGHEQGLHFEQVKRVLSKMQYVWSDQMEHIPFGLILQNGKKMSTRKGRTVLLENVLLDAITLAEKNIKEKNPDLADFEKAAKQVGVGAVIFHDLKNDKASDFEFSIDHMLKFEGDTGPYVQYTTARIQTLLSKGNFKGQKPEVMTIEEECWDLIMTLNDFPSVVQKAFERREPSIVSKYVLQLSHKFNHYYGNVKILNSNETDQRMAVCACIQIVLKEGLRLLGLQTPERM